MKPPSGRSYLFYTVLNKAMRVAASIGLFFLSAERKRTAEYYRQHPEPNAEGALKRIDRLQELATRLPAMLERGEEAKVRGALRRIRRVPK